MELIIFIAAMTVVGIIGLYFDRKRNRRHRKLKKGD